jgi:hypothetical protein
MVTGQWGPRPIARPCWPGLAGPKTQPTGSQTPAVTGRGGSSSARNGGEKGEAKPEAHPELAGGVSLARGGGMAANSVVALLVPAGEIAAIGGDSRGSGSIPLASRWRKAWRTWGLAQRRPGRLLAVARGDSRAQVPACSCGRETERERECPREKEERGAWHLGAAPGGLFSLQRQVRGGTPVAIHGTRRWCLLEEEERRFLQKKKPLGFGRFRGKIKNSSLLQDLIL